MWWSPFTWQPCFPIAILCLTRTSSSRQVFAVTVRFPYWLVALHWVGHFAFCVKACMSRSVPARLEVDKATYLVSVFRDVRLPVFSKRFIPDIQHILYRFIGGLGSFLVPQMKLSPNRFAFCSSLLQTLYKRININCILKKFHFLAADWVGLTRGGFAWLACRGLSTGEEEP